MVIWAEQYPYTSGGPNAGATILEPENFKAMGFTIEESILDPSTGGAFPARMLCASGIHQICERGMMQEGMIADITIFDPERVRENSDYGPGENGLPTTGIPYVLVNGQIAVRDSVVDLDVRAGRAIRYEPID